MIGPLLAAALALPAASAGGEWLVVAVNRVIAPDQHPGECFVQGRVEQVVRGRVYRSGDAIALTLSCRAGGLAPVAFGFNIADRTRREPPTIETLKTQKHALVHVDAGGRVLDNGYWGLGADLRLTPGAGR